MNETDHATYLLKLSKQLVTAAEKRAVLKTEVTSLKRGRKAARATRPRSRLEQEIARLTRKIEGLSAAIVKPAPRRIERWAGVMPVTFVVEKKGRRYEYIASTVDHSNKGLRIRTATALSPGQTLDVYSSGGRLGHCRVVWVAPAGSTRPGEVGLEILD